MRTKLEILSSKCDGAYNYVDKTKFDGDVETVCDAMDEYAKEISMDFVNWLLKDYYPNSSGFWFKKDATRETVRFLKLSDMFYIYSSGGDFSEYCIRRENQLNDSVKNYVKSIIKTDL